MSDSGLSENKFLDIKPLLINFIEYLYPEKNEFESDLDKSDKSDKSNEILESNFNEWEDLDGKDEVEDLEKLEQETLFPYPYFKSFKRKGFVFRLIPKSEEDDKKLPNIHEEIKKYDGNKLLEFWRLVLLDKGSLLTNVICLTLRTLEAMDFKTLIYNNQEILFYGVTIAKMQKINPIQLELYHRKKSCIYDKTDLEKDCYIKLLLIKLKNGKSLYFDYSLSEKGDKMFCNENGFPCNIWKPYKWGQNKQFTIFNTLDSETLQRSFSHNLNHIQESYNDSNPLESLDLLKKANEQNNIKNDTNTQDNQDEDKVDEEIATLFMLTETYINRVYARIYQSFVTTV